MTNVKMEDLGNQVLSRVRDKDDLARLQNMVVPPSFADEYVPRRLPGGRTEVDLYMRAIERGKPVMLIGPAGSGKTFSPFYFAALSGLPLAVIEGHAGFDPEQWAAVRYQNPETGRWDWELADVALVFKYGGIALADELGRIPAKLQGPLLPLFDARRRLTLPSKETIKAAQPLLIVSTTNPPSYHGVSDMDQALQDRHSPIMPWDYDPTVEQKLISSASLRKMAKEVRDRGEDIIMSTRNLVEFEDIVGDLGWDFARAALMGRYDEFDQIVVASVLDNWAPKIRDELGV